ncbi:MAG: hypothetical protein OXC26_07775 [Albidovulum sp.]|nr:hypothetical protein [Albidovulum sp.]
MSDPVLPMDWFQRPYQLNNAVLQDFYITTSNRKHSMTNEDALDHLLCAFVCITDEVNLNSILQFLLAARSCSNTGRPVK